MAQFTLKVPTALPPEQAWAAVWNLRRHQEVIPFTTLTGDALAAADLAPGSRFTARTALGPAGFDDVMTVTAFEMPGSLGLGMARVEKSGKLVLGQIDAIVEPTPAGSLVTWTQHIQIAGVPAIFDAAVGRAASIAYGRTLRQLLKC